MVEIMATTPYNAGLVNFYTVEYTSAIELLLQQTKSKLRGTCREGTFTGKAASPINQIGALSAKSPQGRFVPAPIQETPLERRWLFPTAFELFQYVDEFDMLETVVDPKSGFAEAAAAAFNRAVDDIIINAATGVAQTGVDQTGFVSETFNTASTQSGGFQVPVNYESGSASGLMLPKIREALRTLEHFQNDLEMDKPVLIVGSQQHSDLLGQVEVTNELYRGAVAKAADGRVSSVFGCPVVLSERLPFSVGAANQRGCLMYVKSGIHFGSWKEISNNIDFIPNYVGRPWQIRTSSMMGATRLQPGKVIQILCSDSTGGDITP